MQVIKLNDDIYSDFIIYTASEWKKEVYKDRDIFDKTIRVNLIASERGTTLIFENKHFLVVPDNAILKKYAIWRNHKVIGYCELDEKTAQKANKANNSVFWFGFDKTTNPEKYKEV
nr:MAG TPA: hypothetical protein [Caudoviricetes sp.]